MNYKGDTEMGKEKNINPVWNEFHNVMSKEKGGFMMCYYKLNELVGDKVIVGKREYTINAYDVYLLHYAINCVMSNDFILFQKNEVMADRLGIKLNTLLDSMKKWRAMGFISDKQIGHYKCRLYPDLCFIAYYLGFTLESDTFERTETQLKILARKEQRWKDEVEF